MSASPDQRQSALLTCLSRDLPALTLRQFAAWWPIDSFARRFVASEETDKWTHLRPTRNERKAHGAQVSQIVRHLVRDAILEKRSDVPSVTLCPVDTKVPCCPPVLGYRTPFRPPLYYRGIASSSRLQTRHYRLLHYLESLQSADPDSDEFYSLASKMETCDLAQLLDRATTNLTIVSAKEPTHSQYTSLTSRFPSEAPDCRCLSEYRAVEARAKKHGYSPRHHALAELYLRLLNRGPSHQQLCFLPLRRPDESGTSLWWDSPEGAYLQRMLPIEHGTGPLAHTRLLLKNWHYLGTRDLLTPAPDVVVTGSEGSPLFVIAIALWCDHALELFDDACRRIEIGYFLF